MNLKELINKFTDRQIVAEVIRLYPDQKKNKPGYYRALKDLRRLRKRKTTVTLFAEWVPADPEFDPEDKPYVHVLGHDSADNQDYALSLTPWSEWLSMPIAQKTIDEFGELTALGYIMWEITWYGYSASQHTDFKKKINSSMKDVEKIIEKDAKKRAEAIQN